MGDHRAEGVSKTRPLSPSHSQKGYDDEEDPIGNDYDNDNDSRIHATHASRGLPPARTEAVLAWASALIDAHFVRLALEGSLNEVVCSSLNALGRLTRKEIEGCERLSEVRQEYSRAHMFEAAGVCATGDGPGRDGKGPD